MASANAMMTQNARVGARPSAGSAGSRFSTPTASTIVRSGHTPFLGGRRTGLRATLRSVKPMRLARGGALRVDAKHSSVPEAQVRSALEFILRFFSPAGNNSSDLHS